MRQFLKIFLVSLFLVSLVACKCKDQKEIDSWNLGPYADKLCPILGGLPVFIKNAFPKPYAAKYAHVFKSSIVYFNKEVGTRIMEDVSQIPKYQYNEEKQLKLVRSGHPRVWPFIVEFVENTKEMEGFRNLCELLKLDTSGNLGEVQAKGFAETHFQAKEFQGKRYLHKVTVYVCIKKFEHAIGLMQTKLAQGVKIFGMEGIIRHEMGHLFLGEVSGADKKGHPTWYGDVMKGLNRGLNYHVLELIRQRVVAPCKKNDLLFTPR